RALWVLHNPRFAGAFFFGRSRQRRHGDRSGAFERLPREEWTALIPDAHPGYISWQEFEDNQPRLSAHSHAQPHTRHRHPTRVAPHAPNPATDRRAGWPWSPGAAAATRAPACTPPVAPSLPGLTPASGRASPAPSRSARASPAPTSTSPWDGSWSRP